MINFSVKGNALTIDGKLITFNYPIYKAKEYNNLVIVLLEFKSKNNPLDFTNELYAVSNNGQIIWKMEDVRKHLGKLQPDPLVDFNIIDSKIIAFDFCSRKYTINGQDGSIVKYEVGRW